MANKTGYNYATLESPYDGNLQRINGDLANLSDAVGSSVETSSAFNVGGDSGADSATADSQGGNGVEAGGIEEVASPAQVKTGVVSGQAVRDFWIDTWIKSTNYAPKARGFYIDGPRGYIECRDLFSNNAIITGTITANSGRIANWYINTNTLSSGPDEATSNVLIDSANSLIRLGPTSGNYITVDGANQRIRSSNYLINVRGFTIEPTLVEAENIVARGIMKGATFQYDVVSAVGGQVVVANSDVLASDMTALDASTLTTKGTTSFAVNDILVARSVTALGIQVEYMRVTNIASAPTYTVTRDLASAYAADTNPIWQAGTTIVKQGKSDGVSTYSGGWLRMLGEGTNAPHYSVFSRTGVAYDSASERVRLGNLNGIGGQVVDVFGIFIGDYSAGKYLMYDDVSGNLIVNDSVLSNNSIYGDGSDGDVTIGTSTLLDSYSETNQGTDVLVYTTAETLLDSYAEANFSVSYSIFTGNTLGVGQSIQGNGENVSSCKFFLRKTGSPTGNAFAKIYAATGTYGTNAIPTGAALATSDAFDVSTLTTSNVLRTINFSGANNIKLTNGTTYILAFEWVGGNGSNFVNMTGDATSPTSPGNASRIPTTTWANLSGNDLIFYIYTSTSKTIAGESFTATAGSLDSCVFYLKKAGTPTGNIVAKLYAHTGSFGTTGTPTGSVLATSDNVSIASLTTSYALTTFTFTGAQKYLLTNAVNYFITVEYTDGNASNSLTVGADSSAPTHAGNGAIYTTSWAASAADVCFYVYSIATVSLSSDMYYDDLTLQDGATLNPNGFRIFVKNTRTHVGTGRIIANGGHGGNGANGDDSSGGGVFGGAGGTAGTIAHNSGSLPGSLAGKAGGSGGGDGSYGTCVAGNAGVAGDAAVKAISGAGSAGGAGGTGSGGCTANGAAGAAGAVTGTVFNKVRNFVSAFQLLDNFPSITALSILSGSGSGGGGSSGTEAPASGSGGGGGGGGSGAGGGMVWVASRKVVTVAGNNYIEAKGGNGGNGGNGGRDTTALTAGGGGGGGGGGGRGGVIIEIYSSKSGTGTTSVAGGSAGAAGTATEGGSNGSDGTAGGTGVVVSLIV